MENEVEGAIKKLLEKIGTETKAGDVMQLSQAALNLAHVRAVLSNVKK